jgi:hypothetical protein
MPGPDAGAGEPAGEAVRVVVAAEGAFLEERHASELGAPDDEGVGEQAALAEVADEGGGGLVEDGAVFVVLFLELGVTVPVEVAGAGVGAVEELDEADAAFDQAAGEDAVAGEGGFDRVGRVVGAVEAEDVGGFGGEIAEAGHAQLHTGGEFVAGDAGEQAGVAGMPFEVPLVHAAQEGAGGAVGVRVDAGGREEMADRFAGGHGGALEHRGEEARTPVVRARLRNTPRGSGNGHVGREVFDSQFRTRS